MAWHPFRNMGLKFMALALGTLLWFTVSGQQAERQVPDVAVVYLNKPSGFEITDQANYVDIQVRGLDSQLRTIQARDFEARVDLTDARLGVQQITLRTDQVHGPPGVEIKQVQPGSVMVLLVVSGAVNLPVQPNVDGSPRTGFVVSETTVVPASVTVLGPARRISAANNATTDRVSIGGASATVTQGVAVGVADAALRLREPVKATVTVKIEPAGERVFAAARVSVRNLANRLKAHVEPAVVSIVFRGAQSVLARLNPEVAAPYVDVTGLGPGRHEVPIFLDPVGTLTAAARPASVTVIIN